MRKIIFLRSGAIPALPSYPRVREFLGPREFLLLFLLLADATRRGKRCTFVEPGWILSLNMKARLQKDPSSMPEAVSKPGLIARFLDGKLGQR